MPPEQRFILAIGVLVLGIVALVGMLVLTEYQKSF